MGGQRRLVCRKPERMKLKNLASVHSSLQRVLGFLGTGLPSNQEHECSNERELDNDFGEGLEGF